MLLWMLVSTDGRLLQRDAARYPSLKDLALPRISRGGCEVGPACCGIPQLYSLLVNELLLHLDLCRKAVISSRQADKL